MTLFVLARMKGGGEFVLVSDRSNELWDMAFLRPRSWLHMVLLHVTSRVAAYC